MSNRPLLPGEYYYSVVSGEEDEFHRVDISADAWTGPPEDCIGHWKNRVPLPEEKKRELAPPEVLIDILRSMAEQPAQTKMRYLLALMLVRKRHLKPHENASLITAQNSTQPESGSEPEIGGLERSTTVNYWHLESNLDGSVVVIEVCDIGAGEAESLQAQLVDLLYRDVE